LGIAHRLVKVKVPLGFRSACPSGFARISPGVTLGVSPVLPARIAPWCAGFFGGFSVVGEVIGQVIRQVFLVFSWCSPGVLVVFLGAYAWRGRGFCGGQRGGEAGTCW